MGVQLARRSVAAWDVLRKGRRRQRAWDAAIDALLGLNMWEFRREAQRVRLHGQRLRGLNRRDSRDVIDRVEEFRRRPSTEDALWMRRFDLTMVALLFTGAAPFLLHWLLGFFG